MKRLASVLTTTALLALGACGGGASNEAAADNAVANATDNVTLPPDENSALGAGDTLGNQLNALETENALGNQITADGTSNTATSGDNAAVNATANAAVNGQ